METHTQQHFEASPGPIFERRTANEWLKVAAALPEPKPLLGSLWREGELAILAGGQGLGKSVLATQIAHAVSTGRGFGPFETAAAGQKVVYLDLKLTPKQFAMRYAGEQPDTNYEFDDNLERVHVNLDVDLPAGCRSVIDHLIRSINELLDDTGAKVLIVDNLTQLNRSNDVVRDVLPLMRELNRLKRVRGLSILVVAQSKRPYRSRSISIDDLKSSRILGNFADTIFAIGDGSFGGAERYIKHLKSRSGEVLYDHSLVPNFRIRSDDGGFLGFAYRRCVSEKAMYGDRRDDRDWATIDRIKQLSDEEMSVRDIAAMLEMSKTTVHRLLQMWEEPPPKPDFGQDEAEKNENYFPGREEFDHALSHPRFKTMYESEDEENYRLRREYCQIDNARAYALRIYRETGAAPSLQESVEGYDAERQTPEANTATDQTSEPEKSEEASFPAKADGEMTAEKRFLSGLKHSLNGYGRDIWIEEEEKSGRRVVWYGYNGKRLQRYDRTKGFIDITKVEL